MAKNTQKIYDQHGAAFRFPGKPDEATRTLLKSNGFRWAPSEGAWQRLLNNAARNSVNQIKFQLEKRQTV